MSLRPSLILHIGFVAYYEPLFQKTKNEMVRRWGDHGESESNPPNLKEKHDGANTPINWPITTTYPHWAANSSPQEPPGEQTPQRPLGKDNSHQRRGQTIFQY